ncbi:opsin-5 [Gadus morhua]|uniref:Opsin 5 n=1 Tax=Gadus morhua TaxID=8049 RepID=A0A8C4ZUK3_GADMO|nr:opsin-5-like [Gadus morhua]XP_056437653.1 opsin-5 [Gadus chalcogrammus]
MGNESLGPPGYLPHYLLRGDPFASRLSPLADIMAALYIGIIGILSATGNGYVIYQSFRRKSKLKPPEMMTVNLAIFDFGISVFSKPFFMVSSFSHRWLFGWQGCRCYGWTGFFFGCGSLITLTVVSLDRYLKICHLSYGAWLKRQHTLLVLAAVWFYAAFWATMPLLGWGSYAPEPFGTSCTLDWWLAQASLSGQTFVLSILFFCLVLPTAIIVFSYVKIIIKVKASIQEVSSFDARIKSSNVLEMKLTKVAMLICVAFLVTWIPYAVVSVVSAFGQPDSIPIALSVIPTLLAKSSAMYNPMIYQVMDLKNSCKNLSCFQNIKKRTHFNTSRLYAVSCSLKGRTPANETPLEA